MHRRSPIQSTSKLPMTVGIIKKGKSTPNLMAPLVQSPEIPDQPSKRVKFTYVSPCDKWRTRKQFGIRCQSIESIAASPTMAKTPATPHTRTGRSMERKLPSGVTGRSISRTRRLLQENNADQEQDDTTKILEFIVSYVLVGYQRHLPVPNLQSLTILQYLTIVHDITNTFDTSLLRGLSGISNSSIHTQVSQYKKLAMEVAQKYQIKISPDLLNSPMTQRPNCIPTKKKLSFLRTLVDCAEKAMNDRRIQQYRRRPAAEIFQSAEALQPLQVAVGV